jgi:hypothetical protein
MSDVVRRRIAAVLLVAVIAVAALAITDTLEDPPTEEERVAGAGATRPRSLPSH